MTMPTIPTSISFSQIQTEFGGANPISMSEYYGGGLYVGSAVANATTVVIPSSGAIRASNFSGASAIITQWVGTITGGYYTTEDAGSFEFDSYTGFTNPGGSSSPTTLTDGKTLSAWYDHQTFIGGNLTTSESFISVTGFSSDPSFGYITSAKAGGIQISPYAYSYYGGGATWFFSGIFGLLSSGTSGTLYIYK